MHLLRKGKRVVSLLTALMLCISAFCSVALAAGNKVYSNIDNERDDMGADIKAMTCNVLTYLEGTSLGLGNKNYETRRDTILRQIDAYDPDIIGFQELSDYSSSYNTVKDGGVYWETDMINALYNGGAGEYDYMRLIATPGGPNTINITRGLAIFFRKDRFTQTSSGCKQYTFSASQDGYVKTESQRWAHWITLTDKEHNNRPVTVFNTHLSIPPSETDYGTDLTDITSSVGGISVKNMLGYKLKTQEFRWLGQKMNELSKNGACIALGDFNGSLNDSYNNATLKNDSSLYQIQAIHEQPNIRTCFSVADLETMTTEKNCYDQIFINTNYLHARKITGVKESMNGYSASDHTAYVAYLNYTADGTVSGDGNKPEFDKAERTFTDSTDKADYTFNITAPSGATAVLLDESGNTLSSGTVTLKKAVNQFTVQYKVGSLVYSSVACTVKYSGADKPILEVEGAENHYFANGSYHVLLKNGTDRFTVGAIGGKVYGNAACTTAKSTFENVALGKSTAYVKDDGGEIFPLYILRENAYAIADDKILYVDDDIPENEPDTVAFESKGAVTFISGGVRGFHDLSSQGVVDAVNAGDGRTVYVAPGEYTATKTFTSSVKFIGPMEDVSPFASRLYNGEWADNPKRFGADEAVIKGGMQISVRWTSPTDTIAVRGFYFKGDAVNGHLRLGDARTTNDTTPNKYDYVLDLDITNNIFKGRNTSTNASGGLIFTDSQAQKKGIISGNLFEATGGQQNNLDGTANIITRAITLRNINGLSIDANRFVNFNETMYLTGELVYNSTTPGGYMVATVSGNRFESCGYITNRVRNIRGSVKMKMVYTDNLFVRCGWEVAALNFDFNETSTTAYTDFSKCELRLYSNRFMGGMRAVNVGRTANISTQGDMREMVFKMHRNIFYQPMETNYGKFNQSGTAVITLNFYLDSTKTSLAMGDNWMLSRNYFYSRRVETGVSVNASHNPDYYVCYTNPSGEKSISNNQPFAPWYMSYEDGVLGNMNNSSEILTLDLSKVTLNVGGVTFAATDLANHQSDTNKPVITYDGKAHTISATCSEGGTYISYSLNPLAAEGVAFTDTPPRFTEPGDYKIGIRISAPNFNNTYIQNVRMVVAKANDRTSWVADKSVSYDGKAHSLDFTPLKEDYNVRYTYNGVSYESMPTFTEVGTYSVKVEAYNNYHQNHVRTATLTISKAAAPAVTLTGYSGSFDGAAHSVTLSGSLPADIFPTYSVDGGAFTGVKPSFTAPGAHTVTVRFEGTSNYESMPDQTVAVNITEAQLSGISVTPASGLTENGSALSLVAVAGTETGDSVEYSVNGKAFSKTVPTALRAGNYTVAVRVTRANYTPKMFVTNVSVAPGSVAENNIFALSVRAAYTHSEGEESVFHWSLGLAKGAQWDRLASENVEIVSYGLLYAPSGDTLEDYLFYERYGVTAETEGMLGSSVLKVPHTDSTQEDITRLYEINNLYFSSTAPQSVRYGVFYIEYTVDGETYYEYSDIASLSNLPL